MERMIGLKAAGALLVLLFGGLMGFSFCEDMKNRIFLLQELQKGLLLMHQEMVHRKEPLGEAAIHAGEVLSLPAAGFFGSLGRALEELTGISFFQIWEEKRQQYLMHTTLSEADQALLRQLGRQLDALDGENGSAVWSVYDSRLEEAVAQAKEKYRSRAQLYGKLGIIGGIFLIILLI